MVSEKLRRFVEVRKQSKELEKEEASLSPYVNKLLRRCKRKGIFLNGINYIENEKYSFNKENLFKWIYDQCLEATIDSSGNELKILNEDKLNKLTARVVDEDKLEWANTIGLINLEELPENCYTVRQYQSIRLDYKVLKDNK